MIRQLPDFPWDTLAAAKATAQAHPDGIVDLSVGTPVDPTPELARAALEGAADSPGYPQTAGTSELRHAMADHLATRWQVEIDPSATLPVIGTKELVAGLPHQLGLGPDDLVVVPTPAYPTYLVGAAMVGARTAVCGPDPAGLASVELPTSGRILVWINSPSNPTGAVLSPEQVRAWVRWAREHDAVLASDECYGEFGWTTDPVSVLSPAISEGDHRGLLALFSLSKRSNLAGYRAGFVAGDADLIVRLLAVRKHLGLIPPGPVQAAMVACLGDAHHVQAQRERYLSRRGQLAPALERAGFRIDHSEAGLYLWATREPDGRATVAALAELGILVAPGDFYGTDCADHVRIALTGTDERIAAAVARLDG